jgi:hypothetical protein
MNTPGQRMLLARRLVEAGTRFVSLTAGGWDHHDNIKNGIQQQLPPVDQAIAALISDLDERGLLDSTLVMVTSEFGRTPKINGTGGRDHWPRVFSVGLAGGGMHRGLVHGMSDALGGEPEEDMVGIEDWPPPSTISWGSPATKSSWLPETARSRSSMEVASSMKSWPRKPKLMIAMARALILFLFSSLFANGFSPELSRVEPRGGKLGSEVEIRLYGKRLKDPQELLLYHKGLTVKSLAPGKDHNSVKAVIAIAPDAPLGEHPMRLRCKGGLTYMRTFWVGQFPTVMEARSEDNTKDLNNTFLDPQKVDLNVTVQGVADREDDDYYQVQCKKGQRLSVEVEAMRLGRVMFDPYVAILDKNRFELAVNDDSPLLKRDCAASIIVPEDGPYTVVIRESSYEGNPASQYRMHIGSFPRPRAIFPPAAKPGEEIEFTFIGDAKGDLKKRIKVGNQPFDAFVEDGGQSSPSGNSVHVSALDYINEVEPNENYKQAFPAETHQRPLLLFMASCRAQTTRIGFAFRQRRARDSVFRF